MNITNAGPTLESSAIPYEDDLSIDLELWNSLFFPISLLEVEKFLSSDAQNITCSLLRIGTFIKQHYLGNKQISDLLELADIGTVA